eukprot:5836810-Karenia_brevis.AAC.1
MGGTDRLAAAMNSLMLSNESREELKRTCEQYECRIQVEEGDYYFRSKEVSSHLGGKFWRCPSDGTKWM